MSTLAPALLIAAAQAFLGLGDEAGTPDAERSFMVKSFLRQVGAVGGSWQAAFIHHVGFWSHFDGESGRSLWPLPCDGQCTELATFARVRGVLRQEPAAGDVFLLATPWRDEFVRAGIIVSAGLRIAMDGEREFECVTIEGDTNPGMQRGGQRVLRHVRMLSAARGDLFVRWADLDTRLESVRAQEVRGGPWELREAA